MKSKLFWLPVSIWVLAAGQFAYAEDIDLFVRAEPSSNAPNVLFVIDNAASFSASSDSGCTIEAAPNSLGATVGGIEQCALYQVLDGLPADSVNIGIMVYNDSKVVDFMGKDCQGSDEGKKGDDSSRPGGCLVYPMTLLTEDSKDKLLSWIARWRMSAAGGEKYGTIKAAQSATGGVMQESWAYLFGKHGLSGRNYLLDKPDDACNTYVIFIGNSYGRNGKPGDPQRGDKGPQLALWPSPDPKAKNPRPEMRASPADDNSGKLIIKKYSFPVCSLVQPDAFLADGGHEQDGYFADEWARYLNGHGVTTYTIGVINPGDCQPEYAAILSSMAEVGGGKYFPTTSLDELVIALKTALSEMLAVNSVFASVSLPISVNTEGTYLNQVYIGMFRPDQFTRPRWVGNLKQYRLGRVPDGKLKLVDARDPYMEAISDARTGFLSPCALSYWNTALPNTYWSPVDDTGYWTYPYPQNCDLTPAASDRFDGAVVEKGGQGYTLRNSVAARNLKSLTCGPDPDPVCSLRAFDADAATNAQLGAATDAERALLINWARGLNNRGDEVFDPARLTRASVHGDVVHSRPVAINFESDKDAPPQVVVFYGGNDGVLRGVNGNRDRPIGGVNPGHEMWGFIAPEFFDEIKRLRTNSPNIAVRGREGEGRLPKPYGFDGAISAHVEADEKWIFATMRRGGRMIYAFDVSKLAADRDSPSLLWRFGCPDAGDCTDGAGGMGQSWSAPKVLKTSKYKAIDGSLKPMVIFGGGYDKCEDSDPHSCTPDAKGRAVYVLDALKGNVLATLPTERPVVADVFVVPDGETGKAKLAYAVDMGGNIYRISGKDAHEFGETDPTEWTIKKIAALGCATVAPCANNRKFMYSPDVVLDKLPDGYVLLVGSGDREKPLHRHLLWNEEEKVYEGVGYPSAYGTTNYFFMVRDFPKDPPDWLTEEEDLGRCGDSVICLNSLTPILDADPPTAEEMKDKKGWYLGLTTGEQVVTSAITVFGGTTFSTHTPTDPRDRAVCTSDLGTARVYNVKYANAAPSKPRAKDRSEEIFGGGLPPSPVAGIVILDDGEKVPFIIGADGSSPLEGGEPEQPSLTTLPKSITYWYIEK
jgi:type IV pilus assembly protein PilY1